MDLNLKDKTVLITGGSKGLGRAIAHRFASEGCHLHLVARTQETLDEAANALRQQFPVKIGTFAVDLAQRGSRRDLRRCRYSRQQCRRRSLRLAGGNWGRPLAVSYTHLTLPTILRV